MSKKSAKKRKQAQARNRLKVNNSVNKADSGDAEKSVVSKRLVRKKVESKYRCHGCNHVSVESTFVDIPEDCGVKEYLEIALKRIKSDARISKRMVRQEVVLKGKRYVFDYKYGKEIKVDSWKMVRE